MGFVFNRCIYMMAYVLNDVKSSFHFYIAHCFSNTYDSSVKFMQCSHKTCTIITIYWYIATTFKCRHIFLMQYGERDEVRERERDKRKREYKFFICVYVNEELDDLCKVLSCWISIHCTWNPNQYLNIFIIFFFQYKIKRRHTLYRECMRQNFRNKNLLSIVYGYCSMQMVIDDPPFAIILYMVNN